MGKKKRKSRKSAAARRRRAARAPASRTIRPSAPKPRRVPVASASSKEADFCTEYHYVLGDLKRIAILAAIMLASLVVLALVLR